jgi:hypothetical protein
VPVAPPLPRPPVVLDPAVDDPELVSQLIDRHAPYWPVQRYFANSAEYAALSGNDGASMVVAPVFRGNWALEGDVLEGVEPLLGSVRFAEAARAVFGGADIVRPITVYVNLTWQLPFAQGAGHTDVPAFRGIDRTRYPITFLTIMGLSGLFEDVRVKVATGVAWFYKRGDGGFEYWPDGPDAPSKVHEGAIDNTAIVADNDFMWHRVRPTGAVEDGMVTLTLASELRHDGAGSWSIVDDDRTLATFPRDELRVSLSWKAEVFTDDADRRRHDERTDDITLDAVLGRFRADLSSRGIDLGVPDDPVRDPAFIAALQQAYVRYPVTA